MKKKLIAWALFDELGYIDFVTTTRESARKIRDRKRHYSDMKYTVKKVEIKVVK